MRKYHVVLLLKNEYSLDTICALSVRETSDPTEAADLAKKLAKSQFDWVKDFVKKVSTIHNELPLKIVVEIKEVMLDALTNEQEDDYHVGSEFPNEGVGVDQYDVEVERFTHLTRSIEWEGGSDQPLTAVWKVWDEFDHIHLQVDLDSAITKTANKYTIELDQNIELEMGQYFHSLVVTQGQTTFNVFRGKLKVFQPV